MEEHPALWLNKVICFTPFLASKIGRNNTWILYSGATNHMTPNFQFFNTYEPFTLSKQIIIANGTTIPIKGKGKVSFGPNLSINPVLYVPDLTLSLISIKQLTQDLNCNVVFSPCA